MKRTNYSFISIPLSKGIAEYRSKSWPRTFNRRRVTVWEKGDSVLQSLIIWYGFNRRAYSMLIHEAGNGEPTVRHTPKKHYQLTSHLLTGVPHKCLCSVWFSIEFGIVLCYLLCVCFLCGIQIYYWRPLCSSQQATDKKNCKNFDGIFSILCNKPRLQQRNHTKEHGKKVSPPPSTFVVGRRSNDRSTEKKITNGR